MRILRGLGPSLAAGLAVVVVCTSLAVPATGAQERAESPGTATSVAELIRVNPAIGNLALTIRIGTALAAHQNTAANSEARSIDLGFIGQLLTSEGCDGSDPTVPPELLPEAVLASSSDPASAAGIDGGIDGLIEILARARELPSSLATARLAPVGLPGIAEISGARSRASTTADGHVATAVSEIGRLELAGGLVRLEGLRWEATRRLLPKATTTSSFDIGAVTVGGVPVTLPSGDAIETLQAVLDPVLDPLGIELSFPRATELTDGVELSPLVVGLVPGPLRDGLLAPVFDAIQGPQNELSEFLISLDCGNATYVTVLDVVLGAISGGGFATVGFGGVTARSSDFEVTSFLDDLPGPPSSSPTTALSPTTTAATLPPTSSAPSTTVPASVPTTQADPAPAAESEQALSVTKTGTRGGPLLLVGLAGLLGALALAWSDRRRMRRAQRRTPL